MGAIDNFVHLFAPLAANCHDFEMRWTAALQHGSDGISGCWQGEWISSVTGHRGRLRSVIDRSAPGLWRVYFRGEYSKFFRACYSTDFTVADDSGRWTFNGSSDLGVLAGGAYAYSGYATLDELVCSYKSARDQGEFRLRRFAP